MDTIVSTYFHAERKTSLLFLLIGVLSLCVSLYFLVLENIGYTQGLASSILAIALIQLSVGYRIFTRSPQDILRVQHYMVAAKDQIAAEEIPRMRKVLTSFAVYRYIELALIIAGIYFGNNQSYDTFVQGLGVGLAIQAIIMLAIDYFAEMRAKKYLRHLEETVERSQ